MQSNVKLYAYNYAEARTYLLATVFVACNLLLPQVIHLIPQGGIIFSPLSLVILVGAYKFGWQTGLLAALLSPMVNHLVAGMPSTGVLPLMTFKLCVLALVAGFSARRFHTVTPAILIGVVMSAKAIEALGEWLFTGGIDVTAADFTEGWPGLLLQVVGGWLFVKYVK